MKVKRIDLDDEEMPETVLVEMTHEEAVYVALLLGQQNGHTAEQIMPGRATASEAVYSALTGGLFNRFYDDGVNDAAAALRNRP